MGPTTGSVDRIVFAAVCTSTAVLLWLFGFRTIAYVTAGVGVVSYLLHRFAVRSYRRATVRELTSSSNRDDVV